jgi:hypothetical protein
VSIRGKDITTVLKETFKENFKQQLTLIKNDIKKIINESGDYIMQKVLDRVLTQVTRQLSKLQIKNPELYQTLNTYGGLMAGISMFTEKNCIDPAAVTCVTNSIKGILSSKNNGLNPKTKRNLERDTAILIKSIRPCPNSATDNISANSRQNFTANAQARTKIQLSNLFKKIPFFANVLQNRKSQIGEMNLINSFRPEIETKSRFRENRKSLLADIERIRATGTDDITAAATEENPVGSFVKEGLKNNLTAMLCQNSVSELLTIATAEATERLKEATEHTQTGFIPQRPCLKPLAADPLKGEICEVWGGIDTPAETIGEIAKKTATADIDALTAKMSNPEQGINTAIGKWLKNWATLNINKILAKGFSGAAETPTAANTAISNIAKPENIAAACSDITSTGGRSDVGKQLKNACIKAYKDQVKVAAAFERNQIKETGRLKSQVFVKFTNLLLKFNQVINPSSFGTQISTYGNELPGEIISEYEQVSIDYTDLSSEISQIQEQLNGVKLTDEISTALKTIDDITTSTSPLSREISALRRTIADKNNKIAAAQNEYQLKINAINQIVFNSSLYELFSTKITEVAFTDTNNEWKCGDVNCNILPTTLDGQAHKTPPRNAFNNLFYYLNADLVPNTAHLKNIGHLADVLNSLNAALEEAHILTNEEIETIQEGANYFKNRNRTLRPLINTIKESESKIRLIRLANANSRTCPGTINEENIDLAYSRGCFIISTQTFITQIDSVFSQTAGLFGNIVKFNLLAKLQEIGVLQNTLAEKIQEQENALEAAYNNLLQKFSQSNINLAETELLNIQDEIANLETKINELNLKITNFSVALNDEISSIQTRQPPQEEPSSPQTESSTSPKIGFLQKSFNIITAPLNLVKNLFANSWKLIKTKRVKLK